MEIGNNQDFTNAGHRPPPHQAVSADPGRRRLYEKPMMSRLKIEQVIQTMNGSVDDGNGGLEGA